MDNDSVIEEIRNLKKELVDDMKELSTKIDMISTGHNDLRLEFAKTTAVMEMRTAKLEKDITALWDHNRVMTAKTAKVESDMETHKAIELTNNAAKKGVSEWVRWIPGFAFGAVAMIIAVLKVI